MRIRATHLSIADQCSGAPKLLRELGERNRTKPPSAAAQAGLIVHEWIAIALTMGEAVAWKWLGDHELETDIKNFWEWWNSPEMGQRSDLLWAYAESKKPALVEQPYQLTVPDGVVSMRFDLCFGNRVVDWKFGDGAKYFLPPINEDLQMLSYGVARSRRGIWETIEVWRVRTSDLEVDSMELDRAQLSAVYDWIASIVSEVSKHSDRRVPGVHCETCWARKDCPERLETLGGDAGEVLMVRSPGMVQLGQHSALLWAQHRGAVKDRLEQLDAALVDYIERNGPIELDNKRCVVKRVKRDAVADHEGLIRELKRVLGGGGSSALRTSKGAIVEALKAQGKKPAEREELLQLWREQGLLKQSVGARIAWNKAS
jgi:hypothetical protein